MSKKTNKKSSKNKASKKKTLKNKSAKKIARKVPKTASKKSGKGKKVKKAKTSPAKKASAKKPLQKKKLVLKKNKIKKIVKPASKKSVKIKKVIAKKTVLKPVSAVVVTKQKSDPKPEKKVALKSEKAVVIKAPKPAKKPSKPTTPRKLIPVITKKSVVIDIKTGPEPAGKFELEYVVHSSAQILFEFLTSPSGLSEWFCDDVNIREGIYSFKWEENEQLARVVKLIEEKQVRFQWIDKQDNSYFEFRIERDDLTNDISLLVVDFAETDEERASSTLLWNSQIAKLLHVLGSYF